MLGVVESREPKKNTKSGLQDTLKTLRLTGVRLKKKAKSLVLF